MYVLVHEYHVLMHECVHHARIQHHRSTADLQIALDCLAQHQQQHVDETEAMQDNQIETGSQTSEYSADASHSDDDETKSQSSDGQTHEQQLKLSNDGHVDAAGEQLQYLGVSVSYLRCDDW